MRIFLATTTGVGLRRLRSQSRLQAGWRVLSPSLFFPRPLGFPRPAAVSDPRKRGAPNWTRSDANAVNEDKGPNACPRVDGQEKSARPQSHGHRGSVAFAACVYRFVDTSGERESARHKGWNRLPVTCGPDDESRGTVYRFPPLATSMMPAEPANSSGGPPPSPRHFSPCANGMVEVRASGRDRETGNPWDPRQASALSNAIPAFHVAGPKRQMPGCQGQRPWLRNVTVLSDRSLMFRTSVLMRHPPVSPVPSILGIRAVSPSITSGHSYISTKFSSVLLC
jgi:hypothetical protein